MDDDDNAACTESSRSQKEKFVDLLSEMNLADKYPQKLSLRDAMTVRQETLGSIHTTDQLPVLPYLILQKIMMCDHRCRSCLFKPSSLAPQSNFIKLSSSATRSKFIKLSSLATQNKPSGSDSDSELSDSNSDDDDDNTLHPVDCMLTVLHCSDDILRQDLISKLLLCQLAIPFLLPNPIDNSVTFLLWALRSLLCGWKSHNTGGKEHRMVDYQGPIVSFMRIGDVQSSKSEILNAVIGGKSNIFFNRRECEGDCERNFVDGLVEMCFYLPSGKETDPFIDAVTFLNLRGDAQQHSKQVEFLQKISFICVVLTAEPNIYENTVKLLQSLAGAPGGIILLFDEDKQQKKETKGSRSKSSELLRQALPKSRSSKIKLRSKNLAALSKEFQQLLRERLNNTTSEQFKTISQCHQVAKEVGFKVDEDNKDSEKGKRYAEIIMEKVQSVHFNEVKDKMLPLQGPSLWHQWAKSDKERHRHVDRKKETSVTEYNAQKDREKIEIRKKQLDHCASLTPVMEHFMEYLLDKNVNVRKYYLQWLKLFLDDHSRKIIPKLRTNYQEIREKYIALKEKYQSEENSEVREIKNKLKIQNQQLINASFGLEHLFREMGQVYEARVDSIGHEVSQTLKDKANCLPQIMAEIMDEGHALELMDGDASHVPTLWVLAVIERLKAVCGKDAREKNGGKIFVLSVLGIQSTGKSTLLNTMFGLRLNVSAGRCTRGAYIQLLPLNNSLRQKIDCDYVLIVDTEGLRAPELQLEGLKHDNELATFVIGLADATIINIFGETPGDLDDILQTSLHAFIRMRKIEMNPGCMFVHQNVPDVLAGSKSKLGRQKFHSKLDNMTQAAAKVENCEGQYYSFNKVIDFDDHQDVFYFPNLWKGDPPMAPVNIGYSKSAQVLKTAFIELIQRKQTPRCSLATFKLRVGNLWSVVIQENFVFSFKNTLEVSAYNELNQKCAQWFRLLQNKMLEWEDTTRYRMRNCANATGEIKNTNEACLEEADKILTKTHEEILEKMEIFLNCSDHSETLSRWKNDTEDRIKKLCEENTVQVKKYCENLEMNKVNSIKADELVEQNYIKLDKKITDLVEKSWSDDKQYTDDDLKLQFECMWKEWIETFGKELAKVSTYPTGYEIETIIHRILRELLPAEETIIISKLTDKPLNERTSSLTLQDLNKDIYHYLSSTRWYGFKNIGNSDVQLAVQFSEKILSNAHKYLAGPRCELKPFNPSFVYMVLQDLISSVDELAKPEKKSKFVFTPEYKVDMALSVCVYALDVFKQITQILKQDNDPVLNFSKRKDIYLTDFIRKYKREYDDKGAAANVYKLILSSIKEAIIRRVPIEIANQLQQDLLYLQSNKRFKIQILKDLAGMCYDSELYRMFLFNIPGCFRHWIDHYIDRCSPGTITSPVQRELSNVIENVQYVIREVCELEATSINSWVSTLTNRLQATLPHVNTKEIEQFTKDCNINAFLKYLEKEFINLQFDHQLQSEFSNARSIINTLNCRANPPKDILYDRLIGCTAKCPFCQEQCDVTTTRGSHSGKHSVSLHRPSCLGMYTNSKKLCLGTCTESSPDETFQCSETNWQTVPYYDYARYFPDWYIPIKNHPNRNTVGSFISDSFNSLFGSPFLGLSPFKREPKYWQWFIREHTNDVIRWASAEGADIPPEWRNISRSEAISSLEYIY